MSDQLKALLCVAFLAMIVGVAAISLISNRLARRRSWQEYQDALAALRHQPTSAPARERALYAGRYHYRLCRKSSTYTELRLQNDISAICGR